MAVASQNICCPAFLPTSQLALAGAGGSSHDTPGARGGATSAKAGGGLRGASYVGTGDRTVGGCTCRRLGKWTRGFWRQRRSTCRRLPCICRRSAFRHCNHRSEVVRAPARSSPYFGNRFPYSRRRRHTCARRRSECRCRRAGRGCGRSPWRGRRRVPTSLHCKRRCARHHWGCRCRAGRACGRSP